MFACQDLPVKVNWMGSYEKGIQSVWVLGVALCPQLLERTLQLPAAYFLPHR